MAAARNRRKDGRSIPSSSLDAQVIKLFEIDLEQIEKSLIPGSSKIGKAVRDRYGYKQGDVIGLSPGEDTSAFARLHYHDEVEARLIIMGSGTFTFASRNGGQATLHIFAGMGLIIPAKQLHTFRPDPGIHFTAVRLFDQPDWTPHYV